MARRSLEYYRRAIQQGSKALPDSAVEVPALVLWGEDDPVLGGAMNENLAPWVKSLTYRSIPDCGHWTQQEQPGVVISEMIGWLRAREARRPSGA